MDIERISQALIFLSKEFMHHFGHLHQNKYQRQYNFHHSESPVNPRGIDRFLTHPENNWQERNFENRNHRGFRTFQECVRPAQMHRFHPNPRRECVDARQGRRRLRHHLDDIYLPNYDDEPRHGTETNQYHLSERAHRYILRTRSRAHTSIRSSKFRTYKPKGDRRKINESKRCDVDSDGAFIEIGEQSAEITSSSVKLKVGEEISDERTVTTNRDISTINKITNSRNGKKAENNIVNSVTAIITSDLNTDDETTCLDENDQVEPSKDIILSVNMNRVDSACNMQRKDILELTKKKDRTIETYKKPESNEKILVVSEVRNDNEDVATNESGLDQSVKSKHSSTVAVLSTKLNEEHKLNSDNHGTVKMSVLPANADSTTNNDPEIIRLPASKVGKKCPNAKHSMNVLVHKSAHLRDPRLNRSTTKADISLYLKFPNWKPKVLKEKRKDRKIEPDPDSPRREEIIEEKPSSLCVKRTPSKPKIDQNEIESEADDRNQREPPGNKLGLAQSYRIDFNPKMNITQISNYRKEITELTRGKVENHAEKNKITNTTSQNSKTVTNKVEKNRRVIIRNRKAICRYNHYVLNKYSKSFVSKFNFCCYVVIRREDYDKAEASTNDIFNFLDLIDTRKSYLPQNNSGCTEKQKNVGLSVDKSDCNKSEGSMNVIVSGEESNKKTLSGKSEQDEEMKFLEERVKESFGKVKQDALKKKGTSADLTGKVESKLPLKERFLEIFGTKPIKVSTSATDKRSKKCEKSIVVSNCGKNKEEIKSSVQVSCTLTDKKNKKHLCDPRNDCKISGDKLNKNFGNDSTDVTSENGKGTKRKSVDDKDCSKEWNILKKTKESTSLEAKQSTVRKRLSSTCEDSYVPPKKNCKRRSTIHSSSIFENTNDTCSVPSDFKSVTETIQLISEEIANNTYNVIHLKETEIPKNTSEDILNILSESEVTTIQHDETSHIRQTHEVNRSKNENKVSSFNSTPTYFGLSDILSENISEKTTVLSSPAVKYQRADSRLVEEELLETTEMETSGVVIQPFIDLTSDNENDENFRNVVITNVSTEVSTRVEIKSDPDEEEILLQVKIIQAPHSDKEIKQEIFSICELLGDVKKEVGGTYVGELPLKFAISAKEEEIWEEITEYCQHPTFELVSAVPSVVQDHSGKAELNSVAVFVSVQKIFNDNAKKKQSPLPTLTSSQQATYPDTRSINYVTPNSSIEMIRKIYQRFYGYVYEVLRAYIPLQRAYSGAYQLIYGTLRRYHHQQNFVYEDVSLHLIMHDRRKYYGHLLFKEILRLPNNLSGFNFSDFLRRSVEFLRNACIEVSVPNLVEHLLELIMVYDHEYKKYRASYIFKRNIECSIDSFIDRNGSSQPECCFTQRQRGLLKTQIMAYLQLNSQQLVYLKDAKHFLQVPHVTHNMNLRTNIVDRAINVDATLHNMSNMVHQIAPAPLQRERVTGSNATSRRSINQNMPQTNSRHPNNLQEVCNRMIENQLQHKTSAPSCIPPMSQPPPSYEYSIRYNNVPTMNRQSTLSNYQPNNSSNYLRNTISEQVTNIPVTQLVGNYSQINPSVSFGSVPNSTVSCTNQKTSQNRALLNSLNAKCTPHSSLLQGNMRAPRDISGKFSAKPSPPVPYVTDNGKVNTIMNCQSTLRTSQICSKNSRYPSHSTLPHFNLPVTHQSGNSLLSSVLTSVSVRNNTAVTSAIANSSLSRSTSSSINNLPVIQQNSNSLTPTNIRTSCSVLNKTKIVPPVTSGLTFESASIPTARSVAPDNAKLIISATSVSSLAQSQQSFRSMHPAPLASGSINPILVKTTEPPSSMSTVAVSSNNNVFSTSSSSQCRTSTSLTLTLSPDTGASVTQPLGTDLVIDETTSGLLGVKKNPSANKKDSPAIILQKTEKVQERNQYTTDVLEDNSCVASSLDPYSIDLISPLSDIKEEDENESSNPCEDEIIDLTWMNDFTEEELAKDENQDEFMYIKMEPLDDNPAVPPSPGDSGIDSPPIQRDSNNFEAGCRSVRVEEEDYPNFFSYQFE